QKDGYDALQVGFDPRPERTVTRPMNGHFKKAGVTPQRLVREFRIDGEGGYQTGQTLDLSLFEVGDKVDVVGVSKGRGFAGSQKRHHSSRGPETHGSNYHRMSGSMGASADPSHVHKGKKLPGHMGHARVTVQNIRVVDVDRENHLILVRGSVPGHPNGYVMLRKSLKMLRRRQARKAAGKG
nr:50S ribosomal protein L3 [Candidatus Sumerlaeota bacterium]